MEKKNAHPEQIEAGAAGQASAIVVGAFPPSKPTVTAEVLARLLAGERLTSLDAVFEASTTRLAAVAHYLQGEYGWPVSVTDKAAGCKDGRIARVAEYSLPKECIEAARKQGAQGWCREVRAARRSLRAQAALAATRAKLLNLASRKARTLSEGQRLLWGEL